MRKDAPSEPGARFEWDMVTWMVIALVIVLALLFATLMWPHPSAFPE